MPALRRYVYTRARVAPVTEYMMSFSRELEEARQAAGHELGVVEGLQRAIALLGDDFSEACDVLRVAFLEGMLRVRARMAGIDAVLARQAQAKVDKG